MTLTILKAGLQTTVQSRPRAGLRHQGVPGGGAADPLSLALANRLVGNPWDAPAIEATLVGPTLRIDEDCALAITGAHAEARLGDNPVPRHETVFAKAGDVLHIGPMQTDARAYVAFAGGIEAESILGSASTNLQAAFGGFDGRALQVGDVVAAVSVSGPIERMSHRPGERFGGRVVVAAGALAVALGTAG